MLARVKLIATAAAALVFASGAYMLPGNGADDYDLVLVADNAVNVAKGSQVNIKGFRAGQVSSVEARDGRALITMSLSGEQIPLHEGTKAVVEWKATIGERTIALEPGPPLNPEIPSGSMIEAGQEQVEADELLAALDTKTRRHLTSTVRQLDATLKEHPGDIQQTLKGAGPTVRALGEVLKAVGQDGPAIRSLVTDLREMMDPLAARQEKLSRVVNDLGNLTNTMAPQHEQLRRGLKELPATLITAKNTLDEVPAATDQAVPLLNDLRPATRQLAGVSRNLRPLLRDLRPTVSELRPTLSAGSQLLRRTPGLLDSAHDVVPDLTYTVRKVNPAVDFLRPYTPDLIGWLSNWGNAFASYDSRGHIFRGLIQAGPSAFNDNPGVPVGFEVDPAPAPGAASGNAWTDAHGSGMR